MGADDQCDEAKPANASGDAMHACMMRFGLVQMLRAYSRGAIFVVVEFGLVGSDCGPGRGREPLTVLSRLVGLVDRIVCVLAVRSGRILAEGRTADDFFLLLLLLFEPDFFFQRVQFVRCPLELCRDLPSSGSLRRPR
jgi:hypothetical protein